MRIHFERSGGFAGARLAHDVDTSVLPPAEAQKIEAMVRAADFFVLPAALAAPAPGADRFRYELTVEAEGRRRTVEAPEGAAPAPLQQLIAWLTAEARKGPRPSQ